MKAGNTTELSPDAVAQNLPLTAIRLRERLDETGMTQEDLAVAVKATQGAISQILTGATRNSRLLPKIAVAVAVNLNWLAGLTDEKIDMFDAEGNSLTEDDLAAIKAGTSRKKLIKPEQLINVKAQRIPRPSNDDSDQFPSSDNIGGANPDLVEIDSIDLAYGMGASFLDTEHVEVEKVTFSRSWLRQFTKSPPHLLCSTRGIGDSMMPTIHDQDVVIIDRSQTTPEMGDKIWAVVFAGLGMIKRLRALPDGTMRISSDNQLVRDEIAADGELFIVGRVVAVVKSV